MARSAARRLVLLRHAKSAWPDVADHERPLARRGRRDAPVAGRWLRAAGQVPDRVVCSTAMRARQTWQLAAAELGASPRVSFDQRVYGAAAGELLDLARETGPRTRTLLIVGHDPAMQELALALASARAGDAGALGRVRFKFPTAAIAILEFSGTWQGLGPDQAQLTAFVVPRDLHAGSGKGKQDKMIRAAMLAEHDSRQQRQPPSATSRRQPGCPAEVTLEHLDVALLPTASIWSAANRNNLPLRVS